MTIVAEKKTTVVSKKVTCDILFKRIKESDIAVQCGLHCASKEAISLLPKAIQEREDLQIGVLMGCAHKKNNFHPSLMHKGWWLLVNRDPNWSGSESILTCFTHEPTEMSVTKYYSIDEMGHYDIDYLSTTTPRIASVEDCRRLMCGYAAGDHMAYVFHDGNLEAAFVFGPVQIDPKHTDPRPALADLQKPQNCS